MFDINKYEPVAIIKDGKHKGDIIGLDRNPNPDKEYFGDEIFIKDGTLEPLINTDTRSSIYICGPAGAGKSTMSANYIKIFNKLFPNKKVYMFSRTDYKDDPAFKGVVMKQIDINEDLVNNPIDPVKYFPQGSMVVFDDIGTIHNDKVRTEINKLIMDILETCRKQNIYIIITSHLILPNDRKLSRVIMNELNELVIFPRGGNVQQMTYALKTYFGLAAPIINKILHTNSRWICLHRNYPLFAVYERGCYII